MSRLCISVDVEGDLPGIVPAGGMQGVDEGLPRILGVLDDRGVRADFFFLAPVAKLRQGLVGKIRQAGHGIANHGLDHRSLCSKPVAVQRREIAESTRILEGVTSSRPLMFRAPNFSVNGVTLRLLEEAGYRIDSSVLPGRYMKRFRLLPVYDHRHAAREPHRLGGKEGGRGEGDLLEVPVTENPLQPMTPVGLGAVNRFGARPLVELLRTTPLSTVVFLIHPWEAIDLASAYPGVPEGYRKVCSSDLGPFREFLETARSVAAFSTLGEVAGLKGGG